MPDADPELEEIRRRTLASLTAPKPARAGVEIVTDATFEGFVGRHRVVAVDAWAPWCGPCRVLGPMLEEIAQELAGQVAVGKINVDDNPRVPGRFRVTGIPTVLVFRNGQLADRIVGVLPKAALKERLLRQVRV